MMRHHDLNGDLRDIEQTEDGLRFVVTLPGTRAEVVYSRASGEAKIETRRQGFLETLVLGSIGLFLLGATGIYLWFCHNEERVIGSVLLVVGLIYGITTLVLSIRTVRFRMGLQAEGAPDPADGHAPPLRKLNITRLHPTERCG